MNGTGSAPPEVATMVSELRDIARSMARDAAMIHGCVQSLERRIAKTEERVSVVERRVDALERGDKDAQPMSKKERIERALDELRAAVADMEPGGG